MVEPGAELRCHVVAAGLEILADPIAGLGIALGGGSFRLRRFRFTRAVTVTFQQWIALELSLDIGGEVEIRELQQLDGLHQLRRHHQGLALTKLESLG